MRKSYPGRCAEILRNLKRGRSLCEEVEELRKDSSMTNYAKSQVMYALIISYFANSDMPTKLAFEFLLDWRQEILRDGLFQNAVVPDDRKMQKILSAPSASGGRLREAGNGMSLLQRIYAVYQEMR